ncbi:hypothetical protein LEP1GSC062_4402 [Leptospira alexanderi serovar Manhao 3 str. L 60]|uniref:Uncharacterized protein n=1 Tax=Leptospira alexanderi serovar Manhao 3 str. L 60 TaxID=1049759 RepID=V6I3A9_9LEPT|nr:hypothetical protein LEP1GSC062_4402 [Leptospira alexanderi serovar Manhao 3 str. L 60]
MCKKFSHRKSKRSNFSDVHHTIEKSESFRFFLNEISPIFSLDFKIREKNLVSKRRK